MGKMIRVTIFRKKWGVQNTRSWFASVYINLIKRYFCFMCCLFITEITFASNMLINVEILKTLADFWLKNKVSSCRMMEMPGNMCIISISLCDWIDKQYTVYFYTIHFMDRMLKMLFNAFQQFVAVRMNWIKWNT